MEIDAAAGGEASHDAGAALKAAQEHEQRRQRQRPLSGIHPQAEKERESVASHSWRVQHPAEMDCSAEV